MTRALAAAGNKQHLSQSLGWRPFSPPNPNRRGIPTVTPSVCLAFQGLLAPHPVCKEESTWNRRTAFASSLSHPNLHSQACPFSLLPPPSKAQMTDCHPGQGENRHILTRKIGKSLPHPLLFLALTLPCSSRCGPWISNISLTWEPDSNLGPPTPT